MSIIQKLSDLVCLTKDHYYQATAATEAGEALNYEENRPDILKEAALQYNRFKQILKNYLNAANDPISCGVSPEEVGLGASPSCPLPLVVGICAQHDYRANEATERQASSDSIRTNNFLAVVLVLPFSLAYRIVRAVLRLVLLPLTLLYSLYQEKVYGMEGWVLEDLERCTWEWIDVGVLLLFAFIGLAHTLFPNLCPLDNLRNYYLERIEGAIKKNQELAQHQADYKKARQEIREREKAAKQLETGRN